jgi:hypothetical protein
MKWLRIAAVKAAVPVAGLQGHLAYTWISRFSHLALQSGRFGARQLFFDRR